jgi:hypothetical protein
VTEADALPWLLEAANPSARYLALTDLLERPADDPEVVAARSAIPNGQRATGCIRVLATAPSTKPRCGR